MTDTLSFSPVTAVSANGTLVAAATAEFFLSGTTTPVAVYTDLGLTTPHDTPVVADGNGFFPAVFFSGGAIKAVIKDTLGATLYTIDPVLKSASTGGAASTISFEPTVEIQASNVQDAIEIAQLTELYNDKTPQLGGNLDTRNRVIIESVGTAKLAASIVTPSVTGNIFHITSASPTDIDSFTNQSTGTTHHVIADGTFTLKNSASLIVEGGADKTVNAGDDFYIMQDTATSHRAFGFPALPPVDILSESYVSAEQTITSAGALTLPHGLSGIPKITNLFLICKTAENGYSIGNKVPINHTGVGNTTANGGTAIVLDATNINVRYNDTTKAFILPNFTTGSLVTAAAITNANWRLVVEAFY